MNRRSFKWAALGITSSSVVFLTGLLCVLIRTRSGFNATIWVPTGINFLTLFLVDLNLWPFLLLGEIALYLWAGNAPLPLVLYATIDTAVFYACARYLRKKVGTQISFKRLKDLWSFLTVAALLGPLLCATLETGAHAIFHELPNAPLFFVWRAWWFGQGLSILIMGVLVIHARNDFAHLLATFKKQKWEALFLSLAIIGTSAFTFTPLTEYNHSLIIRPYFLFALMLWASLRFDLAGATFTSAAITIICLIGGYEGYVAFSSSVISNPSDRMVMLQFMLFTIVATGLVVASTVREKSEALEARNEFLDIASHELKTPITSLKLQLQLLQRRLDQQSELSPADHTQITFLNKVDRQVNRLVRIVEQLLDVSRAERHLMQLEREQVDLKELLQQLVDRLSGDILNAKCSFKLEFQGDVKGLWDPFRVEQVLENLISNALKYAPGKPIAVSAGIKNEVAEILVIDHGPGIDPSKLNSIFDRFVRAGDTRHVQGLGLGLFITRRIVEDHGGTIQVSSTPKGTTFTVKLPLKPSIARV